MGSFSMTSSNNDEKTMNIDKSNVWHFLRKYRTGKSQKAEDSYS